MMKIKKFSAILLAGVLTGVILVGCGGTEDTTAEDIVDVTDEEPSEETEDTDGGATSEKDALELSTDPFVMLTQGRYVYSYYAEGYGTYSYYFHFYEEDPVLGAVYYAGFANNGTKFVGTYEVLEEPCDYICAKDRDTLLADQKEAGTAPYTLVFYDWKGNEIDRCGYDGDVVYNDLTEIAGNGSNEVFYLHDTAGDDSEFKALYEEEAGVPYLDFIGADDDTISLSLFHNMTYVDLVEMIVEGDWKIEIHEDGSATYTLTPFDDMDTGAVLEVAADQKTAEYTADDSADSIVLNSTMVEEAKLTAQYDGAIFMEAYQLDAALYYYLYDDNTCELVADVYGNVSALDTGVYEKQEDGSIALTMDKAGKLVSGGEVIHYTGTTDAGEIDTELTLNPDAVAEAEILFSFTGNYTTFECHEDGTYLFQFADYGVEETGTWTWDTTSYQFTITREDGMEIPCTMDENDRHLSFTYIAMLNDSIQDEFTCDVEVWGGAVMQ